MKQPIAHTHLSFFSETIIKKLIPKATRITQYLLLSGLLTTSMYSEISLAHVKKQTPGLSQQSFEKLEKSFKGKIGVYALDTSNNQPIQYRGSERFPIQSTFKVIVVANILKNSETNHQLLQEKISYTKSDLVSWSPITEKNIRSGMTIAELCAAALMYSDNTATNLLMKKLGGPAAVTTFAHRIGDSAFRIDHWEPKLNSNPTLLEDTATPKAMGESLKKLILGNILARQQKENLITWMKNNTTGDTKIKAGVPENWIVADKTGGSADYGVSNDIAIIWPPTHAPMVIAIYTVQNKKVTVHRDDIVASITHILLSHF